MKSKGRLKGFSMDFIKKTASVTLELDVTPTSDTLNAWQDKILNVEICEAKEKRSLDANAYFHLLVGKLADKLRISKPRAKNTLLGRYGQRETTPDGGRMIISVLSGIDMMEREDIHTYPIGYAELQGKQFTHYAVIRGSHTYNTAEMSILIDGTVQEAKAQGIETMTPDELARLKSLWKGKNEVNYSN
jgi:hypothetical protein